MMTTEKNDTTKPDRPDNLAIRYLNIKTLILAALLLTPAIILLVFTVIWTREKTIKKIHIEAALRLNTYNDYLLDKLNTYIVFSKIISERTDVIEYLKHPDAGNRLNGVLQLFNDQIGASATYIMNKDGVTVASSNYRSADSFVGKNFQFRDYFKTAIKGFANDDIAIGAITKKLGYYRASPVMAGIDSRQIIGVAVIKYDLNVFTPQDMNKLDTVLIADDNGVIFYSNDQRYLYRTIDALPEKTLQKISLNKSYADEHLLPLQVIKQSEKNNIKLVTMRLSSQGQTDTTDTSEKEYLMIGTQDAHSVWNIHLLVDTSDVGKEIAKNLFFVLLLMAACLTAIFMRNRFKSKHAAKNSA
ncbi:MAG: hypothetical protein L7F77_05100 [Candidatus Magnetominusculus sp. LBB02]|nr:hypothetical protein [Candidatus Magnetominusculus sp. LBB02]